MVMHTESLELPETDDDASGGKSVNRRYLVNKLNYLNFQDETVSVHLRHTKYESTISLPVKPLPCAGERLDCSWVDVSGLQQLLTTYRFAYLLLNDGKKFLMVIPKVISMKEDGISLLLPMKGREFRMRRIKRHSSSGIGVQITQDSALFQGTLTDFTPVSLRVEGSVPSPQTFKWMDLEAPVYLHLYLGKHILYSGSCKIIRRTLRDNRGTFVLSLTESSTQRFRDSGTGELPLQLVPAPSILFQHPLSGKMVTLKLAELWGSGFTVEESEENSVLMPGMVIPELKVSFGHHLDIPCKAQVVARSVSEDEEGETVAKSTVSILDMDIHEHVKLLSILHQATDKNSYVCNTVDMDALWDFFFETGFVYPEKYAYFQANKDQIKKTYHKLYARSPHIARHFIYQDKGAILGHISMVRCFENSWMIHHHAARKTVSLKAGMTVLNQICQYLHVLRNFHFAHLNYVYCYYRPDNKFPNRVFGGFAQQLNAPEGCSQDRFAFSHLKRDEEQVQPLQAPWELKEACDFDISEVGSFYGHTSGGLMMQAFELHPEVANQDKVAKDYQKLGFRKEKRLYSLYQESSLKALVLANSTDAGLNMANLTNCISLIVLDEGVPREIIDQTLKTVAVKYEGTEIPVLTYPLSYAEKVSFPYEKIYMLWILNLGYLDAFMEFAHRLFKGTKGTHGGEQEHAEM